MEAKPVHIVFLLDRSGSMASLHGDVVGGYNQFLKEQKAEPGKARLTLVQFDTQGIDVIHDAVKLAEVPEMALEDFQPRAGTPLLDAVGKTIGKVDVRLAGKKKPEIILFAIYTDGQENSSHEFTKAAVRSLIEQKTAQGWTFAYMGSDPASYAEAGSMGIAMGSTADFAPTPAGTQAAWTSYSGSTTQLRTAAAEGKTIDPKDFYKDKKPEKESTP